jgi:hypothetical protein
MHKHSTAFRPVLALALALLAAPASFAALPTEQLIAALGHGGPGEGVQICAEIGRRFRRAPLADRPALLAQLDNVLESDPQADSRFGAIACLAGLVSSPVDQGSRVAITEMIRSVLSAERDSTILAAAVRMIPDVDRSESALRLLSDFLNNTKLMQAHPELLREALLSAGRLGPDSVSLLVSFLPVDPETSMIALSATGSAEAVEVLVKEAGGSNLDRRYPAVHALGLATGAPELSDETRELIRRTLEKAARSDSDPDVRQKAAESLVEVRLHAQPPGER